MSGRVVVVGGGMAGVATVRAVRKVDPRVEVLLADPRGSYFHHIAGLRAIVDAEWSPRLWLPYDGIVQPGQLRATGVTAVQDGSVSLADGEVIEADAIVLATGVEQAPVATPVDDDAGATFREHRLRADELARAGSVLILGAGPVGLELAGEIREIHPDVVISVLDPAGSLLAATPSRFSARVRARLMALRIDVRLGDRLAEDPARIAGYLPGRTLTTVSGAHLPADVVLVAYGSGRGRSLSRPGCDGGSHSPEGCESWQHHGSTRTSFGSARSG